MKYRESGMPVEQQWDTFFDALKILDLMEVDNQIRTLIDIGCGFGTFLLPSAKLVSAKVLGIDIDQEMIDTCQKKVHDYHVSNIDLILGDITSKEAIKALEKYQGEIDYISLFNILHCEEPLILLKSAYDILNDNGRIGVIHWKYEETPRGPSMEIRPKPEMIINWALHAGFNLKKQIELPPYHFGLIFTKK